MKLKFVLILLCIGIPAFAQIAYTGLGGSTAMCVDRDGDGYGIGPVVGTEPGTGVNTTVSSPIAAGTQTVTPASMTDVVVGSRLRVVYLDASGTPTNLEYVQVTATTTTTFTANFSLAHSTAPIHITDLGCLGVDADDLDATVHTGQQLISEYTVGATFPASNAAVLSALQALYTPSRGYTTSVNSNYGAYNPPHIWYLAPTTATAACIANNGSSIGCAGSDSVTTCEDSPSTPCATWAHIGSRVASGHMVVMRDGFNDRIQYPSLPNGTAGHPTILMSYPGELATFDSTGGMKGVFIQGGSYIVLDGMRFQNLGEGDMGDNGYYESPHSFHDNIIRHIDGMASTTTGESGQLDPIAGMTNFTVEDSNWHDNKEHGLYVGCTYSPCTGNVFWRNVFYNNGWNGLHINGVMSGTVVKQNLISWSQIGDMAFQSGFYQGTVTDNVVVSNQSTSGALVINNYKDTVDCNGGAGAQGNAVCKVSNATWSSAGGGTITFTFSNVGTGFDYFAGGSVYVYGASPAGYNCGGTGCPITAINAAASQISVSCNCSDPGTYSSGGKASMGVGDASGNLIENNTFVAFDPGVAAVQVVNLCAGDSTISNCDPGQNIVSGWMGSNTFRNNLFINNGALSLSGSDNANYPHAPVVFPNTSDPSSAYYGADYLPSTVFDHNLFYDYGDAGGHWAIGQARKCAGTADGYATYSIAGTAQQGGCANFSFTTGALTGNIYGDPKFVSVLRSYTSANQFDLRILNTSPAFGAGSTTNLPPYDAIGRPYLSPPSIGALEVGSAGASTQPGGGTTTKPPITTTAPAVSITAPAAGATVSGNISVTAAVTASAGVSSVSVSLDGSPLGTAAAGGPYSLTWDTTQSSNGSHTLVVSATDIAGNTGTSSVTVTVSNAAPPPPSSGGSKLTAGTWTMIQTHGVPAQSVGWEKLAYSPATQSVIMFGNYHELSSEPNRAMNTYNFDTNRWDILDVGDSMHNENMPEAGHPTGEFVFDPNLNVVIYYCCASGSNQPENVNHTWWFDPVGQIGRDKFTSPKPGIPMEATGAFDPVHNVFIFHGSGFGTWSYNPVTNVWQQLNPAHVGAAGGGTFPSGFNGIAMASMTYNSADGKIYLFGGRYGYGPGETFANDIYTYDVPSNTWTMLNPLGVKPPVRQETGFAYDSTNNIFLVFGGQNNSGLPTSPPPMNDTWIYDPAANAWTQLNPAQSPNPVGGAFEGLAYDPGHNVFVLAIEGDGGYADGTWGNYPLQTWLFRYKGTGPDPGGTTPTYAPTAGGLNRNSTGWAKTPVLASSGSGLYVGWVENGQPFDTSTAAWSHIQVSQQKGVSWSPLGADNLAVNSEFSGYSEAFAPTMTYSGGQLWVSYYQSNNSNETAELWAKTWNGSAWTGAPIGKVGTTVFQAAGQLTDVAGVPNVAFTEIDKTVLPQSTWLYVKYWNGTQWVQQGSGALNHAKISTTVGVPAIASDGSSPWVAWTEYTTASATYESQTNPQVYVAHWTGSQWAAVGGSLNMDTAGGWAADVSIAIQGGQPYVAWTERSQSGNDQVYVKTFNGTNWVLMGSGSLNHTPNTGWAFRPSLVSDGTNLYVGWVEQAGLGQTPQVYVSKLSSGAWTPLGGSMNANPTTGSAQRVSLAIAGGQVTAAWGEVNFGSMRQIYVKQWNGSSWTGAAPPPVPSKGSNPCDLNGDGLVNAADVQIAINQALGTVACSTADLMQTGQCNAVDVQRVINASLGELCIVGK